jgi:hypothetical protein
MIYSRSGSSEYLPGHSGSVVRGVYNWVAEKRLKIFQAFLSGMYKTRINWTDSNVEKKTGLGLGSGIGSRSGKTFWFLI